MSGQDDGDKTLLKPAPTPADAEITRLSLPPGAAEDDRTRISPPPAVVSAVLPVPPGTLINNNYRIQQMLSQGGMGEVYRAENVFTGDPVALKIVLPSLARDQGIIDLFMREARILGQLTDDAIVRYHNFVLDQQLGRYCLIMEFIDGTTLWDHVDVHGPIAPDAALRLLARLAEGLEKAHARGVTHRDLSPDNVMLRGDDLAQPVLIDFGIARAADMGEGALAGRFAGKFKYSAPEQLGHFGGEVGPQADIYGMALMIAAVVRGRPLDMGGSPEEAAAARRGIPDLSGVPHAVYPLLQYMLEPDPAARPASMSEVAALAADPLRIPLYYRHPLWVEDGREAAARAATTLPDLLAREERSAPPVFARRAASRPAPTPRRRRGPWAAGLAVAALAGAAAVWSMRTPAPPESAAATAPLPPPAIPLPARDPVTPAGFLADFALEPCTQVQRGPSGIGPTRLVALADGPRSFGALLDAYDRAFSGRPALTELRVAPEQCAALDFVRALQGRVEPAPILSLDSDRLTSGGAIAGRVRETRGRPVWLVLIAADGGVHDLSERLVPQADGSFVFSFGMVKPPQETAPTPQLIMVLTGRDALVTPATAPDGAPAAELLPRVLAEIKKIGGLAAADLARFELTPETSPGG